MHTDARTLENGAVLEGDLCIVGAGASGITIARELNNTAVKVLLLEGGGFEFEQQMQDLYRGEIVGQPYFPLQAAALQFPTGHPTVINVLVGARSTAEIDANLAHARFPIPAEFWTALHDQRLVDLEAPLPRLI